MNDFIDWGVAYYQANKETVWLVLAVIYGVVQFLGKRLKAVAAFAASAVKAWIFRPAPMIRRRVEEIAYNIKHARLFGDDTILRHKNVAYLPDGTVKVEKMHSDGKQFYFVGLPVELAPHEKKAMKEAYKSRLVEEKARMAAELLAEAADPKEPKLGNTLAEWTAGQTVPLPSSPQKKA